MPKQKLNIKYLNIHLTLINATTQNQNRNNISWVTESLNHAARRIFIPNYYILKALKILTLTQLVHHLHRK